MKNNIAMIGLSVMGSNLALNMADHDFKVSIYNRTESVTREVVAKHPHKNLFPVYSLEELAASLESPRKIMLMVKAGKAVDAVIEQLLPLLSKGDIIIDGGNSYFADTQRRYDALLAHGIHYFGVGVSGGEEGARRGPAIMPGGDAEAYRAIQPILEGISAKVEGNACCAYTSTGGAGHYVKMVHNGIEYGDMQLISEIYLLLKHLGGFDNKALADIFSKYNQEELESYLIQITANIFKVTENGEALVDKILDTASQKGTGKWTNMQAAELGVDVSVITAALNGRFMSALKQERMRAEQIFAKPAYTQVSDKEALIQMVKESLYLAKVISYAQGFKMLQAAEKEYNWNFTYAQIAKIFRGGCIIQAKLLQNIIDAYSKNPQLDNLIFDDYFSHIVKANQESLRKVVSLAIANHIAVPALSNALSYLDTYTTANSGANLIQAQRDYFGAHTFERTDKEGHFHFDWVGYSNERA